MKSDCFRSAVSSDATSLEVGEAIIVETHAHFHGHWHSAARSSVGDFNCRRDDRGQ
jgi:hypothetical protein